MTKGPTLGFIGIGMMGWPMASRLAPHYDLIVSDASGPRVDEFVGAFGARKAADNAALARDCDVVVLMLPTSAIVEQVMSGPSGVRAGLRPGAIVVDMGSSVPGATRTLSEALAAQGATLVDAPVSGGVPRAEAGTLAIMAGGPAEAVDKVQPVLERLGAKILRTGEVGSAHAMKALNNLASATSLLIGVEVLTIGAKFGLDPTVMVDVLNASSGMTDTTQRKLKPFVLSRRFDAGFGLDLMVKDLGIALDLAQEAGASVPLASRCRELWAGAQRELGPGRDHTEIARFVEARSGVELQD
jgi:3-hydroxyisobutyrate dehydrogenase